MRSARDVLSSPLWDLLDSPVVCGDCVEVMRLMAPCSVDAVVCDPPYGLEFMGKEWDRLGGGGSGRTAGTVHEPTIEGRDDSPHHRAAVKQPSYLKRCKTCGGNSSGAWGRCKCASPDFRERADIKRAMQDWHEAWAREAFRVLKPGGYLLAFGGTRTSHRLVCGVEDAGFEIRDSLMWLHGTGFPKSLDVSKAIDKAAGAVREVVGEGEPFGRGAMRNRSRVENGYRPTELNPDGGFATLSAPATPEARQWEGWGTALKPAHEPIVVARKPLAGTVASNVLEHGTGALNINATRIGTAGGTPGATLGDAPGTSLSGSVDGSLNGKAGELVEGLGRWPANVVLSHSEDCQEVGTRVVMGSQRAGPPGRRPSPGRPGSDKGDPSPNGPVYGDQEISEWECAPGCPVAMLDEQAGDRSSGTGVFKRQSGADKDGNRSSALGGESRPSGTPQISYDEDASNVSRFFYTSKASTAERSLGLEDFEQRASRRYGERGQGGLPQQTPQGDVLARNIHPTVKPLDLMRWLVRLVTPPGGIVLDNFAGSGSTGCAATLEGFDFVGIEQSEEYAAIARARWSYWSSVPQGAETRDVLANARETQARVIPGQYEMDLGC